MNLTILLERYSYLTLLISFGTIQLSSKISEKFCDLDVIHTPNIPNKYPDARFIIASHHIIDVENQLTEMGYNEFYSALKLFENYNVENYEYIAIDECQFYPDLKYFVLLFLKIILN